MYYPSLQTIFFFSIKDYDALKIIALNDYITIFLHKIISKNCIYDEYRSKIESFIQVFFYKKKTMLEKIFVHLSQILRIF